MGSAHRASIIWRRTLPRHQFGFPSHPSGFQGPKGTKRHCNVSKNSPDAQNNGIAVGIYSSDIGNLPGRAAKNIQKIAENEASRREPSPDQARENIYNGMQHISFENALRCSKWGTCRGRTDCCRVDHLIRIDAAGHQ